MKKLLIIMIILNSIYIIISFYLKHYEVILINVFAVIGCVWVLIKNKEETKK